MKSPTPDPAPPASGDNSVDWQTVRQLGHDLNNLIGAIGGYAAMLSEDAPKDGVLAADLRRIHDATERAASIVSTIRTIARRAGATTPPPSDT